MVLLTESWLRSHGLQGPWSTLLTPKSHTHSRAFPEGPGGGKSTPPSVFSGATVGRLLEADPRFPSSSCEGLKVIRLAIRNPGVNVSACRSPDSLRTVWVFWVVKICRLEKQPGCNTGDIFTGDRTFKGPKKSPGWLG